jgi:uncharacterized protein YwqG
MDENLEKLLEQYSRDAIHLVKTKNNVFTKIGGRPLTGKGFEWPKWRNQSLAFVAQIKLSEINLLSQMPYFPKKGLLYFFYDKEQAMWGFDPKEKGSWEIIFEQEHDDLDKLPYPQDLEREYRFREKKLKQKLIKTYPSSWKNKKMGAMKLTDKQIDWCIYFADSVYRDKPRHQIGGIADTIEDPELDLKYLLLSRGLYSGYMSGFDDPIEKGREENPADWILLLQIDSDKDTGFKWKDYGRLYFWIRKNDLEKLDFEKTWIVSQYDH